MITFKQLDLGDKIYKSCPVDTYPSISEFEIVKIIKENSKITFVFNNAGSVEVIKPNYDKEIVCTLETKYGIYFSTSPSLLRDEIKRLIIEFGEEKISEIQNHVVAKLKHLEGK